MESFGVALETETRVMKRSYHLQPPENETRSEGYNQQIQTDTNIPPVKIQG